MDPETIALLRRLASIEAKLDWLREERELEPGCDGELGRQRVALLTDFYLDTSLSQLREMKQARVRGEPIPGDTSSAGGE